MNEKNKVNDLDFLRLLRAVVNKAWAIGFIAFLCAGVVFILTYFCITPKYEASAMFYVNNSDLSIGSASVSISSGDLTTSRNLVDSYIVILNTRDTLVDVIDYAGVKYTYADLRKMISAKSVNETEIFQASVTCPDPYEAERIANAIAYILPNRIDNIIEGSSAKVVEAAVTPSRPSSPNYTENTVLGFLIGLIVMTAIVVVGEVFDISVRSEEDISPICKHPILVSVPNMAVNGKSGSGYYGYGKSKSSKKGGKYAAVKQPTKPAVIGPDISFAASEAYKLLRTKLQFSFADENDCRVIGVSSALSGEGKSLTAVNLAFALSQLNKKVLLIDCDMRRPTLAEKLNILKQPGLSSYLTRQCDLELLVQLCGIKGNKDAFHVISAGQNPPNPIELLSSERMKKALEILRSSYEYIILDLPPVCEVSDAMAVAKETDGMLLVVRQNYCDRIALSEAVRQFEFINSKILGVVFNCISEHGGNYGNGYYKRYYKSYYNKYGKNYGYYDRSASGTNFNEIV